MTIRTTIATPLTVCVAAGWLVVAGPPAEAALRPTGQVGHSAGACAYRVSHVRPGGFLNVRSGPGLGFRPVGRLRVADGRIAGSCAPTKRWVAVKPAKGKKGWASAHYLRQAGKPRVLSYPVLSCSYRVSHVRAGGFLNVRKSPALRSRPVGRLRAADGRIAGSCAPTKRWVAVKPAKGKAGWASAHYLRKVT